ncbi:hypothetical protein T484DRAFT_1910106 [Baffinella frigidus]|nr:hypothetical protein T484DRAFT_1910106 [Cryptophyta sp. CCMP2293]
MAWQLVSRTPAVIASIIHRMWYFAAEEGHGYTAPVWVSEFGASRSDWYWKGLMQFLQDSDIDWAYWAFFGDGKCCKDTSTHASETCALPGSWYNKTITESYGLMNRDYSGQQATFPPRGEVGDDWRLKDLYKVQKARSVTT